MYLEWSDKLNVGIEQIDEQHRELVDILNEMYESVYDNHELSVVCELGERLIQCAILHFEAEDKLLLRHNYPVYQEHCIKHAELTREIQALIDGLRQGETSATMTVMHFLRDWLSVHIIHEDKKVGAYLSAHGCS